MLPVAPSRRRFALPDLAVWTLCSGLLALWACGEASGVRPRPAHLADATEEALRGDGQVGSELTYAGTCTFVGSTLTLNLSAADGVVLSRRLRDNAILVNDAPCGAATSINTKTLNINESGSPGAQTVVLDYLNGLFALGTSQVGTGTFLNYGSDANDRLMLRLTTGADNVKLGAAGINLNGDSRKDIAFTSLPSVVVASLAAGNDQFSAAGDAAVGAAFPHPLTIYGGEGQDTLRGGNGNDLLFGDGGDDILHAEASAAGGADTFDGGAGIDTVTYADRTLPVRVTIGDGANDGEAGEGDMILDTVETVIGGAGDDVLSGSLDPNLYKTLNGGPGNDNFLQRTAGGPDSHDTLIGGAGIDTVDYSVRTLNISASMDGKAADDGVSGEMDNIRADVENIRTGVGDDTLSGNAQNNTFYAGAGINVLSGLEGDDVFDQGDDSLNGANDSINGGPGIDTVDYSGRTADLVIVLDGATPSGDTAAGEQDLLAASVENVRGGTGNDRITGNAANNQLDGGAGDDQIDGQAGDDRLDGGAGTDTLTCGDGSDIASGGETVAADCEISI